MTFAEDLAERYPESAKILEEMAEEETGHSHMLLEMYEQRFGKNLPPIRRDNVRGFLRRRPIWLTKNLSLDTIRKEVGTMEFEAERFYIKAAEQAQDVGVRRLLGDLAEAEKGHEKTAAKLTDQILSPDVRAEEDQTHRRVLWLQYVLSGSGFRDQCVLVRERDRGGGGCFRARGDRLHSRAIHGHAIPAGGLPDRARRRHRACRRHFDRCSLGIRTFLTANRFPLCQRMFGLWHKENHDQPFAIRDHRQGVPLAHRGAAAGAISDRLADARHSSRHETWRRHDI